MSNRKIVLLFSIIVVLGIAGIITAQVVSKPTEKKAPIAQESVNQATQSSQPTFINFNRFASSGLTRVQVDGLEYAFTQYLQTTENKTKSVALMPQSLKFPYRDPNSTSDIDSANFTVQYEDQSTQDAKVEYSGTSNVRLYLYKLGTDSVIYDSQDINLKNQ